MIFQSFVSPALKADVDSVQILTTNFMVFVALKLRGFFFSLFFFFPLRGGTIAAAVVDAGTHQSEHTTLRLFSSVQTLTSTNSERGGGMRGCVIVLLAPGPVPQQRLVNLGVRAATWD